MKSMISTLTVPVMAALLVMAGCVSTETNARRDGPNDDAADTNYQLGAQYYRNGSYELARARLERAVELDARNANAHSLLALTLVQLGNDRLALSLLRHAFRLYETWEATAKITRLRTKYAYLLEDESLNPEETAAAADKRSEPSNQAERTCWRN